MKKKLLALVLATVMTFGASMTVFAADTSVTDITTAAEVEGEATVKTPTIKVTVPSSINVVLNPFQIAHTFSDDTTVYKNQVISVPVEISSASNVALAVNVSDLKAYPTDQYSKAVLASKSVAGGKITTKSVYLYLEVVKGAASTAKFSGSGLVPAATTEAEADNATGTKQDAIITLDAATPGATADADPTPSVATFKVGGDMVANPVKEDGSADPWTTDDKVSISFKFTFTPQLGSLK